MKLETESVSYLNFHISYLSLLGPQRGTGKSQGNTGRNYGVLKRLKTCLGNPQVVIPTKLLRYYLTIRSLISSTCMKNRKSTDYADYRRLEEVNRRPSALICGLFSTKTYSPVGTQIFFTCVACRKKSSPSP